MRMPSSCLPHACERQSGVPFWRCFGAVSVALMLCCAVPAHASFLGFLGASKEAPLTRIEEAAGRPEIANLRGAIPTAPVRLRFWGFDVYDARLWTPQGFRHSQATRYPFALELQYLRRLEGGAIASRSLEEMRRLASISDTQAQSWLKAMREAFPTVNEGDRITGINVPGEGVEFWVNGERSGEIKDPAFATLFFGIWLNGRASEPKLRAQLLQGMPP